MKKIVITSGYFNPMHVGHVNLFREAEKLGDYFVVIVNNDKQVKIKGAAPFMPEQERVEIIKDLHYVNEALLSIDKNETVAKSLEFIAKKYPKKELIFAKGGDRNIDNIPESERQVCQKYNIKVISGVGGGKVQSSSWLINNVKKI